MTIPQAYFELLQRQIDITRMFALAWVDVASSASIAAVARTAALGTGVAGLPGHLERQTPPSDSQHPGVDDIFEEIVELMVVEDLTATAR